MKVFQTEKIRNLCTLGHSGSGKTTLTDAMLFTSGAIDRMGKADAGTLTCDFDPEEAKRKASISVATAPLEWKDVKINIIDAPGYDEYVGEAIKATKAADAALITVSADAGVEVGTEKAYDYAENEQLPRVFFVNKMDKENADFDKTFEAISEKLTKKIVAVTVPIGKAANFKGVVDLIKMKAIMFSADGKTAKEEAIPANMADIAKNYREKMIEVAADADEDLAVKYLEGQEITDNEMQKAIVTGIKKGVVYPVLAGCATTNLGIQPLLDFIINDMPTPAEHSAIECKNLKTDTVEKRMYKDSEHVAIYIFKVFSEAGMGEISYFKVMSGVLKAGMDLHNSHSNNVERIGTIYTLRGSKRIELPEIHAGDIGVLVKLKATKTSDTLSDVNFKVEFPRMQFPNPLYSLAIVPKTKDDQQKLSTALAKFSEEDPTFKVKTTEEFGQTVISGMGEIHVEMVLEKIRRKYNVGCGIEPVRIPYRETIRKTAKAQGKFKRQSGGRGQYGDCHLELKHIPGGGFEFHDKIVGGAIPKQFIGPIEKGVVGKMKEGVIAGYPVIDIAVTVYDGSYHDVDSSAQAFEVAGSMGFKNAFELADPYILEPIYMIEVIVPEAYMGDIMGDLNSRRGKIMGMEARGKHQVIKATVPLSELQTYVTNLRSITQGRGVFTMTMDHYEEAPGNVAQHLKEEYAKAREAGASAH
ncbi:MAG: elongation factor G [Candidatus Wallbacteria bacterium]